jgi:hypothetical protein
MFNGLKRTVSRSAVGVVGAAVAVVPAVVLAPAALAGGCGGGFDLLTANVSDSKPASGEQFIVRGKLIEMGMTGKDHAIRVQTYLGGSWQPIAHVRTDQDGKYRVRVILSSPGKRVLRVVAPAGSDEHNQHTRFVVNVG